jgi:methionyl aminopeptidase
MIVLRTDEEIDIIAAAGAVVAEVLVEVRRRLSPGVTTRELDDLAETIIRDSGGVPAFKGYRGFPATLCVSLGREVVHGMPGSRRLEEGVVVSVDVGVRLDDYFADAARSYVLGEADEETLRLLRMTEAARDAGIAAAVDGSHVGDVSHAVQTTAEQAGYGVVRDLVGHGVGKKLHEDPQVPNYGRPGAGPRLDVGTVIAVEPMVNVGTWRVETLDDGWTVVTADGSQSAHFEHTIAVTENGPRVLTPDPTGCGVNWAEPVG